MRLRVEVALAVLAGSGVAALAACFPSVTFSNDTGGNVTSGSSSTGSAGGSGGSGSASSSASASSSSGFTCKGTDPCDCDGDGDRANTPACNHDGGDCNDHDPEVSSKQTGWFTQPGSNGWDYNCSGHSEYEYTTVMSCSVLCDTTTVGWTSTAPVPDCGKMGQYGTCNAPALCKEAIQGSRPQGCH